MDWSQIVVVCVVVLGTAAVTLSLWLPRRDPKRTQRRTQEPPWQPTEELLSKMQELERRITGLHETTEERYKRMHGLVAQQKRRYDSDEAEEEATAALSDQLRLGVATGDGQPPPAEGRGRLVKLGRRR